MSKLSIGHKATKTGTVLVAFRDARIVRVLKSYGFRSEHLDEGWSLFDAVTAQRLTSGGSKDLTVVQEIGAFENHWFPLVKVILVRHYPQVAEDLLDGLVRTEGKSAAYATSLFLRRLDAMEKGADVFAEDGSAARELLRERGLSDDVVSKAKELRAKLRAFEAGDGKARTITPEERKAAEDAMWNWYLEWSGIARRVVNDGNLLRLMGFKKRRGGNSSVEEELDEEVDDADEGSDEGSDLSIAAE